MIPVRAESPCQNRLARQVDRLAMEVWGGKKPTVLIGRADALSQALEKVARFANESFWDVVHRPYLRHELSRGDAREVIAQGLDRTRGSYKRLLQLFNMAPGDYLKFMDFLRHQQLKPE